MSMRTTDFYVAPELTSFAAMYKPQGQICDKVFPLVPVIREESVYHRFDSTKEAMRIDGNAFLKTSGEKANRLDIANTKVTVTLDPYGAREFVQDRLLNKPGTLDVKLGVTQVLIAKTLQEREYRALAILNTSGNWGGTSTASGAKWDAGGASDPITDINRAQLSVSRRTGGNQANTMIMAPATFFAMLKHTNVKALYQYTLNILEKDIYAEFSMFGMRVKLAGAAYINSARKAATDTYADMMSDNVWVGYVPPSPGVMVPSAGYNLYYSDIPFGVRVIEYTENGLDGVWVEVQEESKLVVPSADCGYLLTDVLT